jgi:hypothetical protein
MRSGLNGHPEIQVSPELLNPARALKLLKTQTGETIISNWQTSARKRHPAKTHFGSLLHRNLYWVPVKGDVWKAVDRLHDKSISLVRDNILRKYLSQLVALALKDWDSYRVRTKAVPKLTVNVKDLHEHAQACWKFFGTVDLRYLDRLVITYEDLTTRWDETINKIEQFLGVAEVKLPQVTVKQETRSLRDSIVNYDEVAKVVTDWGCDRWLHE